MFVSKIFHIIRLTAHLKRTQAFVRRKPNTSAQVLYRMKQFSSGNIFDYNKFLRFREYQLRIDRLHAWCIKYIMTRILYSSESRRDFIDVFFEYTDFRMIFTKVRIYRGRFHSTRREIIASDFS